MIDWLIDLHLVLIDRSIGKIAQLRNKHTQEMAEFEQNQRMIRVRMSQGLQDKLNNRRSRRSRQQMHRRELEALQESPLN